MENEELLENTKNDKKDIWHYNRNPEFLISALRNSEMLLAHAAEHGLILEKENVEMVIKAKFLYQKKEWNTETEVDFWHAYKAISRKLQPVTVSSLLASQEIKVENPNWYQRFLRKRTTSSFAQKAVRFYTVAAVISVALMLILNIYWLKGTTLLNTFQNNQNRAKDIEKRLTELNLIIGEGETALNNRSANAEKFLLELEIQKLSEEGKSTIELLKNWLKTAQWLGLGTNKIMTKSGAANYSAMQLMPDPTQNLKDNIKIMQEAKNLILILGLYILPMFYGLLGGFAFVLRSLASEIKDLVYTKASNIKFTLRILLGALAGLVIGLLWSDLEKQQLGFIESLSPLALAFLAGYSVEFIFNALEKVINSKQEIVKEVVEKK